MEKPEELNNFKYLSSHVKSKLTTRKLQELAAELMTVNDKANALKLYNRSIAVSPSNSIDLPIAYANKSAVLLEMKEYEACVGNINLALKHPLCPIWLVSALFERKIKCLLILGQWNDSTEKKLFKSLKRLPYSNSEKNLLRVRLNQYLSHVYNVIENSEDKIYDKFKAQRWRKDRKNFSMYNISVIHVSDNIEIVQNKTFGRHVIAKNDIRMGELLIKEKAVVSYLYLNEVYDYCSCCLLRTRILIPCNNCSKALFCSKHCMTKAMEQYHRIECPLMEYFANLEPEDQHVQYIMRLACFLSSQGQKLDELIEKWRESRDQTAYCQSSQTLAYILPKNYQTLFLSFDKYSYNTVQFAYSQSRYSDLVDKLKEKTEFFSYRSSTTNEHYFLYLVTNLLIDLEAHFKCNSFCVSDTVCPSEKELTVMRKNVGLACYQESNFFNHSCVPNAAYCFENGDTVSTFSLRRIRAGEQIFICYLNTYYETDRVRRDLMKNYSFQCNCVACQENWPPFEQLQSMYDIRFCECEHHNAFSRRLSVIGCRFCRFKRDLAVALKRIRGTLETNTPFLQIADNLRTDISEAMDLFQSVEGIEVHLIKEYVELYRLFCRCIEIAGNIENKTY